MKNLYFVKGKWVFSVERDEPFCHCIELYEVISMKKSEAVERSGWILPVCLLFLCVFLLLGAVYRLAPQCAEAVQPFFPLLGRVSSGLDEAAEELREGRCVKEAVQVFLHGVCGNAETDPY